jgi:CheY-like chemotaxis protein
MDYHMPFFNGAEVSQQIKLDLRLQTIPVLFLTASLSISGIQAVRANDFIDIVHLADKIKKLVDS